MSSPFGPRLLFSQSLRYDFHRGVDVPVPLGTPMYAVDDGVVYRAGLYPGLYTDGVIQVRHSGWDSDNPTVDHYATYLHCNETWVVKADDVVTKGQLVGYSGASKSGYAHLHFEIRRDGRNQQDCVNPWAWLPYADTPDAHTVEIVSVVSSSGGEDWLNPGTYNVTIRASALKTELDLAGMSIVAIDRHGGKVQQVGGWTHSLDYELMNRGNNGAPSLLDNPLQGNIRLGAERFTVGPRYGVCVFVVLSGNMSYPW